MDLAGRCRLGPDAEYVDRKDDFRPAPQKLETFRAAAERLFGPVEASQLSYDACGIRPKLRAPDAAEEPDFVVAEDLPGFVNLVGIDSPASPPRSRWEEGEGTIALNGRATAKSETPTGSGRGIHQPMKSIQRSARNDSPNLSQPRSSCAAGSGRSLRRPARGKPEVSDR